MPFNSYRFLLVFLPATLIGFVVLGRYTHRRLLLGWLLLASIIFYAYASFVGLVILLPSILLDYFIAKAILRMGGAAGRLRTALFVGGVVANIAFLGYFKYRDFFLGTVSAIFPVHFSLTALILPLGISFITFQKIAFLADVHSGEVQSVGFFDFLLFTLFFPRAIAGPIVHYQEVVPQFARTSLRWDFSNVAVAVCLFSVGLFKKAVIADNVADFADPVFDGTVPVGFLSGWIAALAYTFQLYFDFSGYSDMALALARLFGVRLPMNFNSPLRARSVVEFWTNWHMTLTRFLTAYIYTPLVLHFTRNRISRGKSVLRGKRTGLPAIAVLIAVPTLVTMGLSGLWHGVGFTFIVWGLLHGVALTINQAWRMLRHRFWSDNRSYAKVMRPVGFLLTFGFVVVSMVFFRASSIHSALSILGSMAGWHGVSLPHAVGDRMGALGGVLMRLGVAFDWTSGSQLIGGFAWVVVLFLAVLVVPNSLELLARYRPALDFPEPQAIESESAPPPVRSPAAESLWSRIGRLRREGMDLDWLAAVGAAVMLVAGVLALSHASTFIYWKF